MEADIILAKLHITLALISASLILEPLSLTAVEPVEVMNSLPEDTKQVWQSFLAHISQGICQLFIKERLMGKLEVIYVPWSFSSYVFQSSSDQGTKNARSLKRIQWASPSRLRKPQRGERYKGYYLTVILSVLNNTLLITESSGTYKRVLQSFGNRKGNQNVESVEKAISLTLSWTTHSRSFNVNETDPVSYCYYKRPNKKRGMIANTWNCRMRNP